MVDDKHSRRLLELLFFRLEPEGTALYALLDAARDPAIYPLLKRSGVEHSRLFTGDLSRTLLTALPFLLRIMPDTPSCEQLIERGWGHA